MCGSEMTLVLKIGYRGAAFSGFAEQEGERTVAGELRRALEIVLRRPCDMTCAGRTDAGVSALSQYVSLPIRANELAERVPRRFWRSLMATTPDDISIRGLYTAHAGFSARFDAVERGYRYRIVCGNAQPVLAWNHAWWLRSELDVERMQNAAQTLVGEHDFRSFCKVSSAQKILADGRSTSRYISKVDVRTVTEAGEDLVAIEVKGNAFLHNMVRIMVGSLVEVGRGRRSEEWIGEVLQAKDRRVAGPTAPAQGLVFENVIYPEGMLKPWHESQEFVFSRDSVPTGEGTMC